MSLGDRLAAAFSLDDEGWARHANPASVWTRAAILPALALAVWSRVWIGGWCLLAVAALVVWALVNPRAFPRPARTDGWAPRAVRGERAWIERPDAVAPHHAVWARVLAGVSAAGVLPLGWGLWALEPWAVLCGLALTVGAKLWFLDRMAWLNDDLAREGNA